MNKKTRTIIISSAAAIILLLLMIMTIFSKKMHRNPADLIGNSASNLYNGGTFCQRGNTVYFANALDSDALYSMNVDESHVKKIVGSSVLSINADDHRIYYSLSGKSTGKGLGYVRKSAGLYSCLPNGSKSICYTQNPVATATLFGNTLYFDNYNKKAGTSLYSVNISKDNNHEILKEMINPSCVYGNYMYYTGVSSDHNLHILDPATEATDTFWEHNVYMPVYHNDGWIYYLNPDEKYTLHRYNPATDDDMLIYDNRLDSFNVYGNHIYIQINSKDYFGLHRIDCNGSNEVTIADGIFKNIMTTDEYAYFRPFDNEQIMYHVKHTDTNVFEFIPKTHK